MHFEASGNGNAVVLIHGLFGNLDNLKGLANVLEASYQVLRVDVPNHGKSRYCQDMQYPSLVSKLVKLLDNHQIQKVHLVGHSMGGKIAMAMALEHPQRVQSLIVGDIAPAPYPPKHEHIFNALKSLPIDSIKNRNSALDHLKNQGINESTSLFLLKNTQRTSSGFKWTIDLQTLEQNYTSLINWPYHQNETYQGATLFLRGSESDYICATHKNAILAQFPKAQAKTIMGTGHWLHAEKPRQFNLIVKKFIDANNHG